MSGKTPQQRTTDNLTARGYLCGSTERRKSFPDRKKHQCQACGHVPLINISVDLWNVFDIVAVYPGKVTDWRHGDVLSPIIFVQTTSRNNHSTRRNKILASMEAKLVLLSGARILIQSWRQEKDSRRWVAFDEWITLEQYKQAPHYPSTVAELVEIKRKAKQPDLPPGTEIPFEILKDEDIPF
jgi:hypothetical protein